MGGGYKSDPDSDGDVLRTAYRGVEFPDVSLKTIGLRTVRSEKHDALWFDTIPAEFSRWYYLDWYGYFFNPIQPGFFMKISDGFIQLEMDLMITGYFSIRGENGYGLASMPIHGIMML